MKFFSKIINWLRFRFGTYTLATHTTTGYVKVGDVSPEKIQEFKAQWEDLAEKIGPYNKPATDLQELEFPVTVQDVSEGVYAYLPSDVIAAMRPRVYNTVIEVVEDDSTKQVLAPIGRVSDLSPLNYPGFIDLFDGLQKTFDDFLESHRSTRLCFYIGLEADSVEQGSRPLAQILMDLHERYTIVATLLPPASLQLVGGHYLLIAYVFVSSDISPSEVKEPWNFNENSRPTLYVGNNPVDYSKFVARGDGILGPTGSLTALGALNKISQANPFPWPNQAPAEPHASVSALTAKNDPEVQKAVNEYLARK